MTKENKANLDQANLDWDMANGECKRILGCMKALDIESPFYTVMLENLKLAQAIRREAGDRIGKAFFADAAEFEARMAKEKKAEEVARKASV